MFYHQNTQFYNTVKELYNINVMQSLAKVFTHLDLFDILSHLTIRLDGFLGFLWYRKTKEKKERKTKLSTTVIWKYNLNIVSCIKDTFLLRWENITSALMNSSKKRVIVERNQGKTKVFWGFFSVLNA